jgi:hypothetical protein
MLGLLLLKGLFKFIFIDFIINLPLNKDLFIKTIYNLILIIINKYIKVFKYIAYNKTVDVLKLA